MATAVSGVAAAKVNLGPVNRAALRRYQQFWNSLVVLDAAIADAEKLIAAARDGADVAHSYSVPSAEELSVAVGRATASIDAMIAESKKWEAELVSREWR